MLVGSIQDSQQFYNLNSAKLVWVLHTMLSVQETQLSNKHIMSRASKSFRKTRSSSILMYNLLALLQYQRLERPKRTKHSQLFVLFSYLCGNGTLFFSYLPQS